MAKIHDIHRKTTPLTMQQEIPWEKVKRAMIVYECDDDEGLVLWVSNMQWKDRVWMTQSIIDFNMLDQLQIQFPHLF